MTTTAPTAGVIAGVIIAGGQATRMGGGDKCLIPLAGKPLLARVVHRLELQVGALLLNTNADSHRFERFGLPVAADIVPGRLGPLAGILTGMEWAAAQGKRFTHIVTVAGDTPFLPDTLVAGLAEAAGNGAGRIALARSDGRVHPIFGLWPVRLAGPLRAFLDKGETFKVRAFAEQAAEVVFADFPVIGDRDPFFNINTPEDLRRAETLLGEEI